LQPWIAAADRIHVGRHLYCHVHPIFRSARRRPG
jgi:hypothetical protein